MGIRGVEKGEDEEEDGRDKVCNLENVALDCRSRYL